MSQHTVCITIGRNINDEPATDRQWGEFKRGIFESLRWVHATVIQGPLPKGDSAGQVGVWQGAEEQAATYVAFVEDCHLELLRGLLLVDAYDAQQDAIGFISVPGTEHCIFTESCKPGG